MATCCKEKANSTLLIWTEHLKYGLCYLHIPILSFFKHFSFTSFTFCFSWLSTVKGVIVEPKQQVSFIQPHLIWDQVVSLPFGRGKGRLTTWSHIKCLRHQPCYTLCSSNRTLINLFDTKCLWFTTVSLETKTFIRLLTLSLSRVPSWESWLCLRVKYVELPCFNAAVIKKFYQIHKWR